MLLHVTNGDSVAGTLRQTGLGGAVLPWGDVFHGGPVPRQALLDAFRDGAEVVLWFEHDLYDQVQLIDVLATAAPVEATPELIVVGSFLGGLTAGELEALWPSRSRASTAVLDAAARAWAAFRAPEPTGIVDWATRETPELPFLADAFRRLLEELPAVGNGLSGTERRALQAVADGADSPSAAFVASQRLEDAPFLGDTHFFAALSALSPELIENWRLTRVGEQVLRGEADRVELVELDRWVGGTHVTRDNLWRWDLEKAEALRASCE